VCSFVDPRGLNGHLGAMLPPELDSSLVGMLGTGDNGTDSHPPHELPSNWSSLIGIITAIVGNILIALALNVQRYAHLRLHEQRARNSDRARQALKNAANGQEGGAAAGYGTVDRNGSGLPGNDDAEANEADPLTASFQSSDTRWSEGGTGDDKTASSTYLKSPYWWLGQVLITVGEMGNFLAYGFAPASIVSPLGVFALISNCVIAPILFKEEFRHRDFWGVLVAVAGAVTVVWSAKQEETKLAPHDVWDAITTMEFEVYMAVSIALIILLMWASPRYGNRTILIDLGLVGLYGGYTVLATKGVSSMLSSTLLGAFTTPVTYVLLVILLGTAIMQVRYVNKALQRFDSTQVIPIQFVMFTLCVIIGSAVLYRDFERTTGEQAVKFIGGCLLTFFGVFLITSGRRSADEDEDTLSEAEGVEETIGLSEQGRATPQGILQAGRHGEGPSSRRSSRASRVSFRDTVSKPLTVLGDTGVPSMRTPGASGSKASLPADGPEPSNPWQSSPGTSPPAHPGMGMQVPSSDSVAVASVVSSAASDTPASQPGTPASQHHVPQMPAVAPPHSLDSPVTPRTSSSRPHSHHFQGHIYSPSPLSSTVNAMMGETLLAQGESPLARKVAQRRSRPSLRASLFVPQDELDAELGEPLLPPPLRPPPQGHVSNDDLGEGPTNRGFRGRARSLSNTLSELLGGKRKRRQSSPGAERTDEET
jgi:magnesium transporter